jgi:hypothetical protein
VCLSFRDEEVKMNALDVQARLEYARAAVAVLRALKITDRTMRYADLARAIGLMSEDEKWEAPHRQQIRDILNLVAATERQAGGEGELEFGRIVGPDGQPGPGFYKTSRIVSEAAVERTLAG